MFRYLVYLFFLLSSLLPAAQASERIRNYDSIIQVQQNGDLLITERIKVQAEQQRIQRGIYRDFPTRYRRSNGSETQVSFDVLSVLRDGNSENYRTEPHKNGIRLYIGNQNVILPIGEYEYEITYRTDRQIQFFDHRDELYFNAIPHGFAFPIDNASATLTLPSSATIDEYSAFTGSQGSRQQHAKINQRNPFELTYTLTRPLDAYQGMTILAAWNKGAVAPPSDAQKSSWFWRDYGIFLTAIGSLFAALGYFLYAWFKVGKDPKGGSIIPRFEPPENLSPAACQYILDRRAKPAAFSSSLVNMAVKGCLTISDTNNNKEYLLTKTEQPATLFPGETTLDKQLFLGGTTRHLGGEYSEIIGLAKTAFHKTLKREHARQNFRHNRGWFFGGLLLTIALAAGLIILANPKEESAIVAFMLFIAGFVIGNLIHRFRIAASFWKKTGVMLSAAAGLIVPAVMLKFFFDNSTFTFGQINLQDLALPLYCLAGGLMLILFYHLLEAPTQTGRAVMDEIEGFKLYLSVAEKDLLDFQHAPEKTPELFERYLPYAMALGVENEWGKKFTDILAAAALAGTGTLLWYHGGNHNDFSNLSSDLSSGLDSAISSSSTPPSDSDSGFSGGSSGGGGGGGGGGGW